MNHRRACTWPIEKLVPHARPMLLLDEVLEYDEKSLLAAARIGPSHPFHAEGGVPAHVGIELMAQVPAPAEPGQGAAEPGGMRLVRFVGVDGPRWFVRGLFSGPAADGGDQAALLEEVFRDVVVVRGEHPVPPREILELRLPPEARQALEEQAAADEENRFGGDLNPFERGPEFTETR